MNRFRGHIAAIQTEEQFSGVTIVLEGDIALQAMVIETPASAPYLVEGGDVVVHFKETEVILCLPGDLGLSEPNRLSGTVHSLEPGRLLSWVCLRTTLGDIGAVVPSEAWEKLDLKVGDPAIACIKTTEVMLSEK